MDNFHKMDEEDLYKHKKRTDNLTYVSYQCNLTGSYGKLTLLILSNILLSLLLFKSIYYIIFNGVLRWASNIIHLFNSIDMPVLALVGVFFIVSIFMRVILTLKS